MQNSGVQSSSSQDNTALSNTMTSPSNKQLPFNAKRTQHAAADFNKMSRKVLSRRQICNATNKKLQHFMTLKLRIKVSYVSQAIMQMSVIEIHAWCTALYGQTFFNTTQEKLTEQ